MRITGIDLGQVGGFFKLNTDLLEAVEWGTFKARKGTGDGEGAMFVRLQNRLDEVLADRPDLVTFEDVRFTMRQRGQLVQVRMGGIVQMRCEQLGLEYAGVNVSTLKKFAVGRGRKVEKWEMVAALRSWWEENLSRQWPEGIGGHVADAAWCAIWGWQVHAPTLVELEF